MIFIDATQSGVGFAMNKWASDNNNDDFSFSKSLIDAFLFNETSSNWLPLVFSAGAYDYNYRLSSICLRFPVIKKERGLVLDDNRLDSIDLMNMNKT
jgi:hypothetical protein